MVSLSRISSACSFAHALSVGVGEGWGRYSEHVNPYIPTQTPKED